MKNKKYLKSILASACFLSISFFNYENFFDYFFQQKPIDGIEQLEVPFVSQAPEKNWDEPWMNACEEASILMVDLFYSKSPAITVQEMKNRILNILEVKGREIEFSLDESLETISELIEHLNLGWKTRIIEDPTLKEMVLELENGRPIIVPVYAPELNNPLYTPPGPDYHVVVLTGYNQSTSIFTANDPGSQFGEKIEFSYEVLMDSIHDLFPEDYDSGSKRVLFTAPRLIKK